MSIGLITRFLYETEGHIVTIETQTGETYRGKLIEAEQNMNCRMESVSITSRDGVVTYAEYVYIRGSSITFIIMPDMFKNARMFQPKGAKLNTAGTTRAKSAISRDQGNQRRGARGKWCGKRA